MYRDSLDNTRYDAKRVTRTKTVFDNPLKWKEPKLIFTSSLTDVFHEDIFPFIHEVFRIIYLCRNLHIFQMLTKRPENIIPALKKAYEQACELGSDNSDYLNLAVWLEAWLNGHPPSCVWLGVSIESDEYIERGMLLRRIPAHIRFISFEPMLEEITPGRLLLTYVHNCPHTSGACYGNTWACCACELPTPPSEELPPIDWVILGGESGNNQGKYTYRPCQVDWIEQLAYQFQQIGTAVFIKQLGTHLSKELGLTDRHGTDPSEWPEHLQIQDFPAIDHAALLAACGKYEVKSDTK